MNQPKSLLMPLSTSGHVPERLLGALSIARYFSAHLEVLHAQITPSQFLPHEGVAMPDSLLQQLEQVAGKHSAEESSQLQQMFTQLCDQQGINLLPSTNNTPNEHWAPNKHRLPSAHWQEVNGLRSELVAERGKVADLIIIPQSKSGKPTSTFEAAIMRSGKPVILVPRTLTEFKAQRVMIAWNGSTEVARAVSHALPILAQAKQVVVTTSASASYRQPDLNALQHYLQLQGIHSEQKVFDSSHRPTGEAILETASKLKCDLLVTGAFTHRRVHEQIFGGVTQYMMAHAELPVLMMH